MSFDVFTALTQHLSEMTIHNVRLVDVKPNESGYQQLVVEHGGATRELVGGGRWSEEYSRGDIGRVGYLAPAPWMNLPPLSAQRCSGGFLARAGKLLFR